MSDARQYEPDPVDLSPVDIAALEAELAAMAVTDSEALDAILRLAEVVFPDGVGMGARERLVWPEGRSAGPAAPTAILSDRERLAADARRSEVRFQSLVEQVPAVVFSAALGDADNEIYVSPHIETVLGFTQKEWIENPLLWYSQLHPDDHAVVIDAFTRGVQTGQPFRAEVRFISRDGEEVWILGEARLIRDDGGRLAYFQGVGFDITPSKRAQAMMAEAERVRVEAAQLRTELYVARNVELAELNEQLRVAVEQAETAEARQRLLLAREREVVDRLTRLDADKNDFVSSVSHELRTPVTSMLGYLEMLGDGDAGPLNDQQHKVLEVISRNSWRLLRRIEDLLTVSGLEAGKMRLNLSPVAVPPLVEGAIAAMAPAMADRRLEIAVDVAHDASTAHRRRRAPRPGPDQPAQQRGQVHARRRPDLAHREPAGRPRRAGRRRHRLRHPGRRAAPGVRALLPVVQRPADGRVGHRPGPGHREGHRRAPRGDGLAASPPPAWAPRSPSASRPTAPPPPSDRLKPRWVDGRDKVPGAKRAPTRLTADQPRRAPSTMLAGSGRVCKTDRSVAQ